LKLTEEQIEEYSKGWNIRVNRVVATRFLKNLETSECTYIQALQYIHKPMQMCECYWYELLCTAKE